MAQNKDHSALDFGRVPDVLGDTATRLGVPGSMLNIL
jgi:hypothetical protein